MIQIDAPKVRIYKDGPFEINEAIAGVVPMALPDEQNALTDDIRDNGQRDPIALWQGQVVDGRCRMKSLTLLKMPYIYKELDDDLTLEEVIAYVKSVNTRRNLTLTQKIIVAVKNYLDPNTKKLSIKSTAKAWGISMASLNNALYIADKKPEFIEPLFNGLSVEIIDKHGEERVSNKITAIWAYVKREEEKTPKYEEQHAWSADSHISTQAGKEWFYDFIKEHKIQNVAVMMALGDTANCRYPIRSKDTV
jgi:hypothetical protein